MTTIEDDIDAAYTQMQIGQLASDEATTATMAKRWGKSTRQANTRLEEMIEAGIVTKERRKIGGKWRNVYKMVRNA